MTTTLTPTYVPVDPYQVRQAMIDDGVLFILLPDGIYRPVTAFEPVKETKHLADGTPFPYTVGWNVHYDGAVQMVYSHSADDSVLYMDTTPKVGMGATLHYPNDRQPFTVIQVLNANTILVQEDLVQHISGNFRDGNVKWESTPNEFGLTYKLRYTDKHGWRSTGSRLRFTVGSRGYYRSPEI